MGRRKHTPGEFQRRQVEAMAGYGVPETDIARVVGIDPKTLRRHYRDELSTGHIKAAAKVAESLFRKATSDGPQSVTAAIFWLKTRVGWKETTTHEIAGRDGGPIEMQEVTNRDLAKAILAALGSAANGMTINLEHD
jgi:hypothetical protein